MKGRNEERKGEGEEEDKGKGKKRSAASGLDQRPDPGPGYRFRSSSSSPLQVINTINVILNFPTSILSPSPFIPLVVNKKKKGLYFLVFLKG